MQSAFALREVALSPIAPLPTARRSTCRPVTGSAAPWTIMAARRATRSFFTRRTSSGTGLGARGAAPSPIGVRATMNILSFYPTSAAHDWIERARAAKIVEIERKLQPHLRRAGAEWVGPCPKVARGKTASPFLPAKTFSSRRPSGIGGDVITMVMHARGCDFNGACAYVIGQERPSLEVRSFDETLRRQKLVGSEGGGGGTSPSRIRRS